MTWSKTCRRLWPRWQWAGRCHHLVVVLLSLPSDRPRFHQILREEGRRRPVAWVSCEGAGIVEGLPGPDVATVKGEFPSVLGLAVFDGSSASAEALALVGAHGQWIDSLSAWAGARP